MSNSQLQDRADELQNKINAAMNDVENMVQEYSEIMNTLKKLNLDVDCTSHKKLLSHMLGSESSEYDYMTSIEHLKKLEGKQAERDSAPDVCDNSEIWDRMANARAHS